MNDRALSPSPDDTCVLTLPGAPSPPPENDAHPADLDVIDLQPRTYRWRGVEADLARRLVKIDGVYVFLRPLEMKLLATLLPAAGTLFSRADLMRLVWGVTEPTGSRTLDTHVRRLRKQLGRYADAIETTYRFGYRWREEDTYVGRSRGVRRRERRAAAR